MRPVRSRSLPEKNAAHAATASQRIVVSDVTEQAIRERAYEIFLARGNVPGNAVQDWLRAEQELRAGCAKLGL